MKNKKYISLMLVSIFIFILAIPALAVETRASDQITLYNMAVTPISGMIDVKFSVTGAGIVNKLGCQSIYVYKKSGSNWIYVDSRTEDDDGMSRENFHAHKNNIDLNSESGVEYKVVVTIYAENDEGRDTRTKVFYVTGK